MTKLKMRPMLSLLLALIMIVTALPMTALAADLPEETDHVCTDENCTHEHTEETATSPEMVVPDEQTADYIEPLESPEEELDETTPVPSDSEPLTWELDDDGMLYITGTGYVEPFTSADEQPWAAVRDNINAVFIDDYDGLEANNIAYWFKGCANLEYAEIPDSVHVIGNDAFAGCVSLHELTLLHETNVPRLTVGAFLAERTIEWREDYDPRLQIAVSEAIGSEMLDAICDFNWDAENCPVHATIGNTHMRTFALAAASALSGVGTCSVCKVTCAYTEAYEQWTADVHCHRLWCSNCGYDQAGGVLGEPHTFSHYNSSYDRCSLCGYQIPCTHVTVCYHTSTYRTWSGCNWTEYCSSCGAYISSGTSHGSTYTTWSGCNWYEYCNDCGQLMDSGVSHSYSYGSWQYYSTSQHRRTGTCTSCGATTYSYGSHSKTAKYSPYNSTQHSYGQYCATCASYVGSVTYANHTFTYGAWQNYSATQHRRPKTCSICGYSEYEYSSHSLSYGSWTNYSATQHRRTVSCATCGYSSYEYASHSTTAGSWSSISATQHQRTLSCSCGYSTTETAAHSLTYGVWQNYSTTQHRRTVSCSVCGYSTYEYANHSITNGAWASISDTQHQRTNTCSCGYSKTETGAHTDADNDGYCDDCDYLLSRFSVTVPASLSLVVSKTGEVYSANNAAIVNNSTGAVEVTAVTVTTANGWTLAPYSTNMANAKVDTKLIGFALNGAATGSGSNTENLTLSGSWSITKGGSLPLAYDAVISAMSEPVSEQVLTIMFVLDWAVR